jgi:site-specific DNA recombinase
MMVKAVIYARYSSDNQREESIEAQVRAISDYADRNGYNIIHSYIDEAYSAKTDNRPQFLKMISDAKSCSFDVVICHKLDRFARNRYDSAFYKKTLKDYNVKLVSVLENFDDSPESIILESVLEGMAEYYSANLAREVMKGLKENALQCRHTGGKPPFGYDVKDNEYIINEKEAAAVIKVFEMAASGQRNICNWLNENGYRNKYGNTFVTGVVTRIIQNEKYKGTYIYGQYKRQRINGILKDIPNNDAIRIEGGIPAIVNEELWKAANAMYNKSQKIDRNNSKITYLLSGLIECGECGHTYAGERTNARGNRSERIVYRCIGEKKNKICHNKPIRKDNVEEYVIGELDRLFSKKGVDLIIEALYEEVEKRAGELPRLIRSLDEKIPKIDNDLSKLIDMALQTSFSDSIKSKIEALEMEKADIKSRIEYNKIELGKLRIPPKEITMKKLRNDMNIKNKSPEEQKRIIGTYVQKVIIYPDRIKIITDSGLSDGAEGSKFLSLSEINRMNGNLLYSSFYFDCEQCI